MEKLSSLHLQIIHQITECLAPYPQVEAVAVGGSLGGGTGAYDSASDIDLYVYTRAEIPLETRHALVERIGGASRADFDLHYWGSGDLLVHAPSGIELDLMYFDAGWMESQIARVVDDHQPSLGYTTCFWYTVRQSLPFHDARGWFAGLQQQCNVDYPEALRQNIIRYNHPVLRGIITSYAAQIEKAVQRRDLPGINHRLAALLASYFDILFAFNRRLHPGEKRQLEFALHNCPFLPQNLQADLASLLLLSEADLPHLPGRVNALLDRLDEMLERDGVVINPLWLGK